MGSYFRTQEGAFTANGQTSTPVELIEGGFAIYFWPISSTGQDAMTIQIQMAPTVNDNFLQAPGDSTITVPDGGACYQGFVPVVGQKMRMKVMSYDRRVDWKISY